MLVLFVVALVGTAVALPQIILAPGAFQQQLHILPASAARHASSNRAFASPIAPALVQAAPAHLRVASSALSPALHFAPTAAHFRPLLHDASALPYVTPPQVPAVPLRTINQHAALAFAPAAPLLVPSASVLAHKTHASASARNLVPAPAPHQLLLHDSPVFSLIAPPAPALSPFRSAIPAAITIAPAANVAPAIAPLRTVINDVSSSPSAATHPAITTVQRVHLADESGQFSLSHTDSAGSTFQESGRLVPTNDGLGRVLEKSGSYQYTSPEGTPVSVSYTADSRGFHPISSTIPLPPQPPHNAF